MECSEEHRKKREKKKEKWRRKTKKKGMTGAREKESDLTR